MKTTEVRIVDGHRVEIERRDSMGFGASSGPGVFIRVTPPEPYETTLSPYSDQYDTLASARYHAPGREIFDPERINTLQQPGAYVFHWAEDDEWERWLTTRITALMDSIDPELTIPEIVKRYKLNQWYVAMLRRIAGTDRLPARKQGRVWMVRASVAEQWVNTEHKRGPVPKTA